jgi:hypothetical protein
LWHQFACQHCVIVQHHQLLSPPHVIPEGISEQKQNQKLEFLQAPEEADDSNKDNHLCVDNGKFTNSAKN